MNEREIIHDIQARIAIYNNGYDDGSSDTVARIVAWLREGVNHDKTDARGSVTAGALDHLADAIERGEWKSKP